MRYHTFGSSVSVVTKYTANKITFNLSETKRVWKPRGKWKRIDAMIVTNAILKRVLQFLAYLGAQNKFVFF